MKTTQGGWKTFCFMVSICICANGCLCLWGPEMNWQLIQDGTLPSPNDWWDRLQLTPVILSSGTSGSEVDEWMNKWYAFAECEVFCTHTESKIKLHLRLWNFLPGIFVSIHQVASWLKIDSNDWAWTTSAVIYLNLSKLPTSVVHRLHFRNKSAV